MSEFEDVVTVPAGIDGTGQLEHVTVLTGRMRRPESVGEWCQMRLAAMGSARVLPAGRVVAELLSEPGDADMRALGKPLDPWQRNGVLKALRELEAAARESYPPASSLMSGLARGWKRQWGDKELVPPRDRVVVPERGRQRPLTLGQTGLDAARAGAAWAAMGAARRVLMPA